MHPVDAEKQNSADAVLLIQMLSISASGDCERAQSDCEKRYTAFQKHVIVPNLQSQANDHRLQKDNGTMTVCYQQSLWGCFLFGIDSSEWMLTNEGSYGINKGNAAMSFGSDTTR
jgi:hypothetical protein